LESQYIEYDMGWMVQELGLNFKQGREVSLTFTASRPTQGPYIFLFIAFRGFLPLGKAAGACS
jgi:hypothetical protein